jgi:hypothetical protein
LFPSPFVPPAASEHSTSSTTSQGPCAAPASSTMTQSAPTYSTAPRAPWIPPRHAAPSYAPPHEQQRGGGYQNSRLYGYFTAGLDAENQREELCVGVMIVQSSFLCV